MLTFTIRRLLSIPPLVLVVSLLTFLLLKTAPGDFYSQQEADPARSLTEVLRQKESAGLLARLAPKQLQQLGEFSEDGATWAFRDDGQKTPTILRDGIIVEQRLASRNLLNFQVGATRYQCDDEGVVYRKVGPIEGFFTWFRNALNGDFGRSYKFNRPVFGIIAERLWNTLTLSVAALAIAYGLGVPLGIYAAVKPNSPIDHTAGIFAFIGLSVPTVFSALLAVLFATYSGLFPIGDMRSLDYHLFGFWGKLTDRLHHLFLPAMVLGTSAMAGYMRQARGNMIEALGQDYVRTARAKGVSQHGVLFKHAFRNAMNPLVTMFGYSLASLLSGSLLVEIVMNWPGLGRLVFEAISAKDEPLVLASVLISTLLLVFGNLVADLLLALVDPRVRLS
ncbi:MAG: ABC transporter permease [Planctomycetota bacterium]|nr:ABC transporter permease [Planctomycetota bacterium]